MFKTRFRPIAFILVIFSTSVFGSSFTLDDIKPFTASELASIKRRYPAAKENKQLFSDEQFDTIEAKNLGPLVAALILHRKIKLKDLAELVEFAENITESGFELGVLEPRILRHIKNGAPPFIALNEAIEREKQSRWRQQRVDEVTRKNRPFVTFVNQSRLSDEDKKKVTRVYAVCISSFENAADRELMQPNICDPSSDYQSPRYKTSPSSVKETLSINKTEHSIAYRSLMEEALRVAEIYDLTDFERFSMAKCIAERSIRFFIPSHHPFKAVYKEIVRHHKRPDEAFFMRTGICSNFSATIYNAARALGLAGRVFLVRKGTHVYLEFRDGQSWYHAHPFNKGSVCDMTRYRLKA